MTKNLKKNKMTNFPTKIKECGAFLTGRFFYQALWVALFIPFMVFFYEQNSSVSTLILDCKISVNYTRKFGKRPPEASTDRYEFAQFFELRGGSCEQLASPKTGTEHIKPKPGNFSCMFYFLLTRFLY